MKLCQHERMILALLLTMLGTIALLGAPDALAQFGDDREQIARQLQQHEQAVKQILTGFRTGDEERQRQAQADLAAAEAYLSVLDFPANDPRLLGHLFDEQLASSPANVSEFSSRIFHLRLERRTGYRTDFDAVLNHGALSDAKAR